MSSFQRKPVLCIMDLLKFMGLIIHQGNTSSYLVHVYFTYDFSAMSKSKGPDVLNYFQYILIFLCF